MKRCSHFVILACLMVSSRVFSQQVQEVVDTAVVSAIKNEAMNRSQVTEILSYLSDLYGPRLTWSPEYKEAAQWASAKLKEWGLQNVHYEYWAPLGKGWSLKNFSVQVVTPRAFPLIAYPKAWSPSIKGTIRSEVVYLDAKTEADLEKYRGKLKNAIVFLDEARTLQPHFQADATRLTDSMLVNLANAGPPQRQGMPDSMMLRRMMKPIQWNAQKLAFCEKEGAAIAVSNAGGDDGTVFTQGASTGQIPASFSDFFSPSMNPYNEKAPRFVSQISVAAEHYNRIMRMMQKGQHVRMEVSLQAEITKPDSGFNIIAEIPGTDLKDEVVMIGAHFDSWQAGTGATDNGTGSAVCLEAVRILEKLGLKPRRTIRIGLWGGEEEGLYGSRGYVARHFAERGGDFMTMMSAGGKPAMKPEYEKLSVYFNNDNGAGKVRGVHLQGNEEARSIFRVWLSKFNDPTAQTLSLANTGGTDHLSYDAVGLPGFQFIQDPLDYGTRTHHSNMDLWDRAPGDDLKQASAIMAAFAYNAAMMSERFPRKPMPWMNK